MDGIRAEYQIRFRKILLQISSYWILKIFSDSTSMCSNIINCLDYLALVSAILLKKSAKWMTPSFREKFLIKFVFEQQIQMLNAGRADRERRCWLLVLNAGANIVCQHKNVRYICTCFVAKVKWVALRSKMTRITHQETKLYPKIFYLLL
jgi:hypothetical protein